MNVRFESEAEHRAAAAAELAVFGGLNLLHVKREIAELLQHVGREQIFSEYTKHDISHVDGMLGIADWLIPPATAQVLTTADWLLIVLSTYFHDVGMLVTNDEYNAREQSRYPEFKSASLLTGDDAGRDYASKVNKLNGDELERFLYQEFVRAHHAERIKNWIENPFSKALGAAEAAVEEVARLLAPLPEQFRRDLANVCESHHLDDLDNAGKYPIRHPYGNGPQEHANVQYAAIILRSVDLLQVTRDRTPSISYRILNPSDPVSQQEWAKQMAVYAISPQSARDEDGNVDDNLPKSTIEYHANFKDEAGFFGLTHYLSYAESQLNQSYQWAEEAQKRHGSKYRFPWRHVDQTKIKTDGFLREQFSFEIDQTRILDLLTGHTLYNNSNVVLRELTQNAIDAVRLQHNSILGQDSSKHGRVAVHWNSAERVLEILDNGSGMTQGIIQDNFLKVGSSRYQEKAFRESYPEFSPISRFGIGVLSAFMVADSVEVITVHPDEEQARLISLRSVHGKYLIRLIDKDGADETVRRIGRHGTCIRLRIRASATVQGLVALARRWFVLPQCRLTVTIDDREPILIGYATLRDALIDQLEAAESTVDYLGRETPIEVRERQIAGVSVAYAVKWSPYFRVWELLSSSGKPVSGEDSPGLGICVEGVRVRLGTPGFDGNQIYAIANVVGPSSPRTNVARSDLEVTGEYRAMIRNIYACYLGHIEQEISELCSARGRSLTGAVAEGGYLLSRLTSTNNALLSSRGLFLEQLRKLPATVIEFDGKRENLSLEQLARHQTLHTVQEELVQKTEGLIQELPAVPSLRDLVTRIPGLEVVLPDAPLIVKRLRDAAGADIFETEWEVAGIHADVERPRLELVWRARGEVSRWLRPGSYESSSSADALDFAIAQLYRSERLNSRTSARSMLIPSQDIVCEGLDGFVGVESRHVIYLVPGAAWMGLLQIVTGTSTAVDVPNSELLVFNAFLSLAFQSGNSPSAGSKESLRRRVATFAETIGAAIGAQRSLAIDEVVDYIANTDVRIFDIDAWVRRVGGPQ